MMEEALQREVMEEWEEMVLVQADFVFVLPVDTGSRMSGENRVLELTARSAGRQ